MEENKGLIGFCINRGSITPKNIVQKWSCQVKSRPNWASTPYYNLTQISQNLNKIKHWKILNQDYKNLENLEATWFIDPPYQFGGEHYIQSNSNINYSDLAEWCKNRKGQVIVCENSKANWLPFVELVKITGQKQKTTEVIFTT